MLNRIYNRPTIRISGIGACMISGYPHQNGSSFYDLACDHIAVRCDVDVLRSAHSFGGFPAPRAAKYLTRKVLPEKPDYVVIQLASLDALCPVRQVLHSSTNISSSTASPVAVQMRPTSWKSRTRWLVASAIGIVLRLQPTTPLPQLLQAMDTMIGQCLEAGATPVIVGPFVYGSLHSMRSAIRYTKALRTLVAGRRGAIFVDATPALRRFRKTQTLQADGFHLSRLGHAVVAQQVASAVVHDIRTRHASLRRPKLPRAPKPSRAAAPARVDADRL